MGKKYFLLAVWYAVFATVLNAQIAPRNLTFNPVLKPFYHGVASGDPTTDGLVLWTRVTPDALGDIAVEYSIALDTLFQQVVQTGTGMAIEAADYTLKIAVTGLQPNTVYYYYFRALGANSLVGRAKTCPVGGVEHLRFGVVSCANYQSGYFSAYGHLATRNDLDAVIHLGDYIYEYGAGGSLPNRLHEPTNEILTLADYRTRYALYRLDPHLIRLHQQHTIINVWDDHESANDSYTDGAENHQASEGTWAVRKAISKQVYFEWMPMADHPDQSIYRALRYGNLCDIFMLDTRLEGRDMPPPHFDSPEPAARHIISDTQEDWLLTQMKASTAQWKLMGNQVLFSTFNIGFAAGILDGNPDPTNIDSIRQVEDAFIDNWESYPTQRNRIIDSIKANVVDNVLIVSGDSHCSWAFDVTKEAVLYPLASNFNLPLAHPYNPVTGEGYDKTTGNGSYAVEFGVPSVSSANFDERVGYALANQFEAVMSAPIQPFNIEYNPHLKYVDLDRHGYIVLDLLPDTAQANYYYIPNPTLDSVAATFGKAAYTLVGQNRILLRDTPSLPKNEQAAPAPLLPLGSVGVVSVSSMEILGISPNPAHSMAYVQIGLNRAQTLKIIVFGANGRVVKEEVPVFCEKGIVLQPIDLSQYAAGMYRVVVEGEFGRMTCSLLVL